MSRTDARIRYTQGVLKQALLSFLQEKPINKITVKEVCERAELWTRFRVRAILYQQTAGF